MGEAEKEHPPSSSVASGAADLAGKAKQTLQEGAGSVEKVVDEAKSKLHVRKRSPAPGPASGWTPVSTLRYDGAGYNFVRRVGGPLYIYPVNLPGSGDGPYRWEDLPSSHQAQLKKSVENLKKAQANGWARAEHHMGVSPTQGSRNGFYRLPGFAKDEIIVKQRGNDFRFEYSQAGLLRSSRKTVPFSELPEHLKLYASNYVARHPDVPWASVLRRLRKRAPAGSSSGWQQVDSLRYPEPATTLFARATNCTFTPSYRALTERLYPGPGKNCIARSRMSCAPRLARSTRRSRMVDAMRSSTSKSRSTSGIATDSTPPRDAVRTPLPSSGKATSTSSSISSQASCGTAVCECRSKICQAISRRTSSRLCRVPRPAVGICHRSPAPA